jgi:hypothetical protein
MLPLGMLMKARLTGRAGIVTQLCRYENLPLVFKKTQTAANHFMLL